MTNDERRGVLRALLDTKVCLRAMEVHDPVSAMIVEHASAAAPQGGNRFDAFWSSSLTDSAMRGLPDIEVLDIRSRLAAINDVFAVTTMPLIIDGDTGGPAEHFECHVQAIERAGVSAVVIEDKTGLKRNSLLGTAVVQELASPAEFAEKIRRGKSAQRTDDFMIFARIESLILGAGMADALERADRYVAAGADGIMIHSRQPEPEEVLAFADAFRFRHPWVPLMCVPTSYHKVTASALQAHGFNVVVYANHMLRAAYKAMRDVSRLVLVHDRTAEIEQRCIDVSVILDAGEPNARLRPRVPVLDLAVPA